MTRAIVIDTETTGLSPHNDRIIEIAIVELTSLDVLLHTRINPGIPIPQEIVEKYGTTDAMVADAPSFVDVCGLICQIIHEADVVIGQNPWFDRGMICAEVRRCGDELQYPMMLCTKRTWDIYEPREQRHLMNAFKRFVDREGFQDAHTAIADAVACARVFNAQLDEFGLRDRDLIELDPEQMTWWGPSDHVIWSGGILTVNFGKWKGTPVSIVPDDYWRWIIHEDFPQHIRELANFIVYLMRPGEDGVVQIHNWVYGRKP